DVPPAIPAASRLPSGEKATAPPPTRFRPGSPDTFNHSRLPLLASQRVTVLRFPIEEAASVLPAGEKASPSGLPGCSSLRNSVPVLESQMRTVASAPAVARVLPSG